MRTFLFLAIALWASIGYTDEWVASPTPLPQSIHSLGQILPPPTVIVEKTYPSPTLTSGYRKTFLVFKKRKTNYLSTTNTMVLSAFLDR